MQIAGPCAGEHVIRQGKTGLGYGSHVEFHDINYHNTLAFLMI
jgi:hypothetical protein